MRPPKWGFVGLAKDLNCEIDAKHHSRILQHRSCELVSDAVFEVVGIKLAQPAEGIHAIAISRY
jgi:hypothetical protein